MIGTDHIQIVGLTVFGYHGVNRIEREKGQNFVIDVDARMDLSDAGYSDLLGRTMDYDSVVKEITRVVSAERYTLLEALAQRIADVVLEHDLVRSVTVRVAKPEVDLQADVKEVAVQITRDRR